MRVEDLPDEFRRVPEAAPTQAEEREGDGPPAGGSHEPIIGDRRGTVDSDVVPQSVLEGVTCAASTSSLPRSPMEFVVSYDKVLTAELTKYGDLERSLTSVARIWLAARPGDGFRSSESGEEPA